MTLIYDMFWLNFFEYHKCNKYIIRKTINEFINISRLKVLKASNPKGLRPLKMRPIK